MWEAYVSLELPLRPTPYMTKPMSSFQISTVFIDWLLYGYRRGFFVVRGGYHPEIYLIKNFENYNYLKQEEIPVSFICYHIGYPNDSIMSLVNCMILYVGVAPLIRRADNW